MHYSTVVGTVSVTALIGSGTSRADICLSHCPCRESSPNFLQALHHAGMQLV